MPNMDSIQFKTKELQIKMYLSQIHRLRLIRVTKAVNSVIPPQGFPYAIYTSGGFVPLYGGGVQGDKALMGALMRGDTDLTGET